MAEGGNGDDRNWLRLLSHSVRDTAGSAAGDDSTVLQAVKNLQQLCSKGEQKGDLVARVYPHLKKIFSWEGSFEPPYRQFCSFSLTSANLLPSPLETGGLGKQHTG